jgi:hypothetical protein
MGRPCHPSPGASLSAWLFGSNVTIGASGADRAGSSGADRAGSGTKKKLGGVYTSESYGGERVRMKSAEVSRVENARG